MHHTVTIRTETFVIIEDKDDTFNDKIKEYESNGWIVDVSTLTVKATYSEGICCTLYRYCIVAQRDVNGITGEPIV